MSAHNGHRLRSDRPEHSGMSSLARLLDERVMGFLALVALAMALSPMVFDFNPSIERTFMALELVIVAIFAADIMVQGALAKDRAAWIRSPWRIVDALTVLGPVVALIPQVSDFARTSVALRMLRVGRAVAFGARASVAAHRVGGAGRTADETPAIVSVVAAGGDLHPAQSDWASFVAWARQPKPCWGHASNLSSDRFYELAEAAGVSEQEIDLILDGDGHARLREGKQHATLMLQMPTVAERDFPAVQMDRILAIVTSEGLLTATTGSFDLPAQVEQLAEVAPLARFAFPSRMVCAVLALARARHQTTAQRFGEDVRRLEALDGGPRLLKESFELRGEISSVALELWHLKGVVRALADGKVTLRGTDLKEEKYLDDLLAETESLYETVNKSKDELRALIEFNINTKSFEMNSLLKLLAIASSLGLIPAIAGGLLGMNVAGNPWSVTLGQVAFGVAMGMATVLYIFALKGWLK